MVIGYTVRIVLVRTFIPLKTEKVTKPMFVFYVNFHIALFNDKSIKTMFRKSSIVVKLTGWTMRPELELRRS